MMAVLGMATEKDDHKRIMAEGLDCRSDMLSNSDLNDVISKTVNHVMNETSELTSEAPSSSKRRKQNDNQVRRPMNAFMVYAQVARKKVAGKYPNLSYRKLSKTLGELWRMLDDDERRPFVEEAERLRREHKRAHPTYKFKPQRRRKKAEKQSELETVSQFGVGVMNPNQTSLMAQETDYTNDEFCSAGDVLNSPYHSRNDSAAVSTIWPFITGNTSEYHRLDSGYNISSTRGFPSASTITANSTISFPHTSQRHYINPTEHSAQHDMKLPGQGSMFGRPQDPSHGRVGSQNNSIASLPERSSDYITTRAHFAHTNTSPFSESYSQASSIENLPYTSDRYSLGIRGITSFTRPTGPITNTNTLPATNTMETPYTRSMFAELSSTQSRNEPILNFMEHI
ncbi:transcription factor SOX-2-like [Dendronephthya gigantea]|uniref:transcription factor SOX-2-like n=1 Tax=Dendronephthya gigantea TaxID=151771 RepID=UPI00106B4B9A|nr:transcription factor SOX-2-like [Dendronephthya gigantea]